MKLDNFLRARQHFGTEKNAERQPQQESEMVKQRGQCQVEQARKMEALRTLRLARDADLMSAHAQIKSGRSKVGV